MGVVHPQVCGPARIVSLVPSITELLFALGLGDQVVGRTTFCIHPADKVADVGRVGGTKKPRFDRIQALGATHVIVNVDENRREDAHALTALGLSVVVTHPVEPDDNIALFHLLGGIFNKSAEAAQLARELADELALVKHAAKTLPSRDVLYLIWQEPWMTISPPTYVSRMLALVNWRTVGGDDDIRYPEVDVRETRADLLLLSSEPFPFKAKHIPEFGAAWPSCQSGVNGHPSNIHLIDGEYVSWYGSRAIAGVRYLREFAEQVAHNLTGA